MASLDNTAGCRSVCPGSDPGFIVTVEGQVLSGGPTAPRRVGHPFLVSKPRYASAGSGRLIGILRNGDGTRHMRAVRKSKAGGSMELVTTKLNKRMYHGRTVSTIKRRP